MSAVPKRVSIDAKSATLGGYPILSLFQSERESYRDDTLSVSASGTVHVMLSIKDAHAAREYANMLQGCVTALVEYAEAQERAAVR